MEQKLIDKEKLRMELRKLFAEYPNLIDKGLAYTVEDVIDEQPIVEAETVKHGHWTLNRHEYGVCSVCHQTSMDIIGGEVHNYCPNCGASMDEKV